MRAWKLMVVALVLVLAGSSTAVADGYDAGVFLGMAAVGKAFDPLDPCTPDGGALVMPGPGLGLPVVNAPKAAVFAFAGMLTAGLHGTGPLLACGDLYPIASNVLGGVGAACGFNKGTGQGSFAFPGTVAHPGPGLMFLSDLVWKASIGGYFVVTGGYAFAPLAPPVGSVAALVAAGGGADCITKADGPPKAGGADAFTVVGVAAVVPGVVVDVNSVVPLGLGGKCPAFPPCIYGGPK